MLAIIFIFAGRCAQSNLTHSLRAPHTDADRWSARGWRIRLSALISDSKKLRFKINISAPFDLMSHISHRVTDEEEEGEPLAHQNSAVRACLQCLNLGAEKPYS